MELIVPLNVQGDRPLYEQIYQYIKDEIRKGNIRPEKQLPSSRDLAKSLKVSRSTTQLAYEQLVSEGYLEAVPRKGYFAASLDGIFPPVARSAAARTDQKKELSSGMEQENAGEQLFSEKMEVDFSPRGIDLEGFPYATWRKISRAVLKEEDRDLFLKGDPQGGDPGISPCGARRELRCIPDHHRSGKRISSDAAPPAARKRCSDRNGRSHLPTGVPGIIRRGA